MKILLKMILLLKLITYFNPNDSNYISNQNLRYNILRTKI